MWAPKLFVILQRQLKGERPRSRREGRLLASESSLVGLHDTQVPEITGNSDNTDYTGQQLASALCGLTWP